MIDSIVECSMNNEVWPCDNPNRNLLSQELLSSGKQSGLGATFQGDASEDVVQFMNPAVLIVLQLAFKCLL